MESVQERSLRALLIQKDVKLPTAYDPEKVGLRALLIQKDVKHKNGRSC